MHQTGAIQVDIGQLQLNCSANQQPVVLDALDSAEWPATRSDEILLLRRLQVDAEAWAIGREAVAQLRALMDDAPSPWSADINQSDALRFADRAEYVALLCREIVQPAPQTTWLLAGDVLAQQALRAGSPAPALLSILSEQLLLLPSVFARLAQHQLLEPVLMALGSDTVNRLSERLVQQTGFSVDPRANALAQSVAPGVTDSLQQIASLPEPALRTWRQALRHLAPALQPYAAWLAAIVLAWQYTPQILLQPASANHAMQRLRQRLLPSSDTAGHTGGGLPSAHQAAAADGPKSASVASGRTVSETPADVSRPAALSSSAADSKVSTEAPSAEESGEQEVAQHTLFTAHGGFFLLLNLLRMQPLPAAPGNAWQHLYQLCVLLGVELDTPLLAFLATQLQLDSPERLRDLPVEDYERKLLALAGKRYPHQPFWPHGLIQRAARVRHDEVHVDVDFHADSVDLQIRLNGLDVDPGWLPWLGRVVRFHYLDDPALLPGGTS